MFYARRMDEAEKHQRMVDGVMALLRGDREELMKNPFLMELGREIEARARAEGEARGRAKAEAKAWEEGYLEVMRELCLEAIATNHPELLAAATPIVEASSDTAMLKKCILEGPKTTSAAECARLLGLPD